MTTLMLFLTAVPLLMAMGGAVFCWLVYPTPTAVKVTIAGVLTFLASGALTLVVANTRPWWSPAEQPAILHGLEYGIGVALSAAVIYGAILWAGSRESRDYHQFVDTTNDGTPSSE